MRKVFGVFLKRKPPPINADEKDKKVIIGVDPRVSTVKTGLSAGFLDLSCKIISFFIRVKSENDIANRPRKHS